MTSGNESNSDADDTTRDGQSAGKHVLADVIDAAADASDDDDGRITGKEIIAALGDRSYGPLFIVFGIAGGTPIAVVPGAAARRGRRQEHRRTFAGEPRASGSVGSALEDDISRVGVRRSAREKGFRPATPLRRQAAEIRTGRLIRRRDHSDI